MYELRCAADLKKQIEQLCSKTKCTYEIEKALGGITKAIDLGQVSINAALR